ncbi:MAG: tetratricopeptide repeat protein [Eubacteriales bacterium]|nr:tetratricopeptide repeat protein [Eubacteriales bacterium]
MMAIDQILTELNRILNGEQPEQAETFLKARMAEAKQEKEYGIYISLGNELTGFYRGTGRYGEALATAEDVLLLMEELQLEDTVHFATTLLNAANAYRSAGRFEEALADYRRAMQIYQRDLPKDDSRLIGLYRNISLLLERIGENGKAILFLNKAAGIQEKQPDSRIELACVRTDLALLYLKTDRISEAQRLLEQAAAAFREDGGHTDARYGAALAGLGEAAYRQGGLERAMEYYERALFEVEKHFGRHQGYGLLCGNCALVCRQLGRTEQAQEYERQREKYCPDGA